MMPFHSKNYRSNIEDQIREASDDLLRNEDPATEVVFLKGESLTQTSRSILIQDNKMNSKIRRLNKKQIKIFDVVHDWCRKSVKKIISIGINFGNAGCGKPFLKEVLCQNLTKIFSYRY